MEKSLRDVARWLGGVGKLLPNVQRRWSGVGKFTAGREVRLVEANRSLREVVQRLGDIHLRGREVVRGLRGANEDDFGVVPLGRGIEK